MPDLIADIKEFHTKFDLVYEGPPRTLPEELAEFRAHFLREEVIEYLEATDSASMIDQLDALVDIVYVALGTAYFHGFDFAEAWRRVHAANMTKVRAKDEGESKRNSSYDVVKPISWVAPDLSDLVN